MDACMGRRSGAGCRLTCPLTPDPSPPLGARGVCCVFWVVKGRVGRAKLLLSRTSFEDSGGSAGASPSHGCGYGPTIRCRLQVDFPPHPRPLSPVGGEGSMLCFLWL